MVARKVPTKVAPRLIFRKEWISDPVPEFKKQLNPAVLKQLEQAKKEFGVRINQILKG